MLWAVRQYCRYGVSYRDLPFSIGPSHEWSASTHDPHMQQAFSIAWQLHKDGTRLRDFKTIAALGTPRDTPQELRIESFFPIDDETRDAFRSRAA